MGKEGKAIQPEGGAGAWAQVCKGDSSRLLVHLELFHRGGGGCDAREGGEVNLGRALCHAKELDFVLKTSGNYGRVVSKGMRFLF